ncbi:class I SAM-dependent methyltransferase [Variovorax sp. IB41]|uniref:class I SAM-dependent methyltransferase n=1 Tax=Variovorax sp. IB41 TaxID=2779370 RepID=UPI0018E843A1|nr:class I SAM-dependent methyltransferase [Variovorax sp. IB41]MBJ2156626.1 class I SAM-dependent methyltransferase [Variovorax sp. IB41]
MTAPSSTPAAVAAPAAVPDYAAIKQRQQATWASGDYTVVGTTLQIVGETLAEAADVRADERVLDVAAGNGNATLAAARRFARVTSTDYVQALLDKGRARAAAEGLDVTFEIADAEALPYADATFDVVLSTFGVMFAPDHASAAREMLRVVRSGGRIALANWTPEGFIGRLFKIIGTHVAPPAGVRSPALWGSEPHLVALFGPRARDLHVAHRKFHFRYRSAAHFVQVFREFYGPTHKAFGALDAAGQAALQRDITALLDELDIGGGRGLVVPSEYAEAVITVA